MSLRLTIIFLTTFATVFAAPAPADERCKAVAAQIEKGFKEVPDFQDILNLSTLFSYNNVRYNIDLNNTHLQGVDQTTAETVKDCKVQGNRSLSMKLQLNMGNPRIVSDVYYTNGQDKNPQTKQIEVASYASSDIVYEVQVHYSENWKRVAVIYTTVVKTATFVSDSDCEEGIQFCDGLHSKLDQAAWNQIYNRIPYLLKQALFQMEL